MKFSLEHTEYPHFFCRIAINLWCTNTQPNTLYEDGLSCGYDELAAVMKDSVAGCCINIITGKKHKNIQEFMTVKRLFLRLQRMDGGSIG